MENKMLLLFVKNFVFGFVIYGLITPALENIKTISHIYENMALSREILAKATIAITGGMAILFTIELKSKLITFANLFPEKPPNHILKVHPY